MVSVRVAKSKGSQFEYDCQYSISKVCPEIYRTSERGFQLQYDLEGNNQVIECKRLKGISWNQAKKFFEKLERVRPEEKTPLLLFKSNRQPCLVMYRSDFDIIEICDFESYFGVEFQKHPSTRRKKNE